MDVMTAIVTRRSEKVLTDPAPSDGEFHYLLRGAATAPDHGRLRPWRWILVRGEARAALDRTVAPSGPRPAGKNARGLPEPPLRALLVFSPLPGHRIPEWEQLAASCSMTHALMMLLHALGYGSIWRTGRLCTSPGLHGLLRMEEGERLLGSLDIGTPPEGPRQRRPLPDVSDRVSVFEAATAARPAHGIREAVSAE
ncbi:nitroreductase family protein [Streptomyces griseocarneus]|uniref:nitroreductase family protein n=1 Tax=Streptomyces griseocarneus TaxID=51201 RepID=UPI00167D756B|nr:nitroreductase family protein [Streptomyces griseocarneus]MBZ6475791.1 nitroreductase family protein [Streptomyces griseocarneus]GHG50770.1 nitroreductase [Streptomyces griseocarneus]